jgi:hypothetical protein
MSHNRLKSSAVGEASLVISMMRVTNAHPEDIDVELEHLARLEALRGQQQARINSMHSESTHDFHQK